MYIVKDQLIGRNKIGEKYFISVKLRDRANGVGIDHREIPEYKQLSFTGVLTSKHGSIKAERGLISLGQNYEYLNEIEFPARGFDQRKIERIAKLWSEWHLNDMRSHCVHQNQAIAWDLVDPCPITGYKAGHAWLVNPVSDDVISEIRLILADSLKVSA